MEFYASALNALPSEVSQTTAASTLLGLQSVIIQILSQAIKKLHCAPHKVLLITRHETREPPRPATRCLPNRGCLLHRASSTNDYGD